MFQLRSKYIEINKVYTVSYNAESSYTDLLPLSGISNTMIVPVILSVVVYHLLVV